MPIENDAVKGKILERLLSSGERAREEFIKTGREVERYGFSRSYAFEYSAADEKLFFQAKVAKTAQFLDVVGSALYQTNPHRRVLPRPWTNPIQQQRAQIMEWYLNYTPEECDLYTHSRRAVTEGLSYGMGILWTGWNDRKKVVQSVHDTVDNLLLDPDARMMEELGWVARRRVRPREELVRRFPESAAKLKQLQATHEKRSDQGDDSWQRSDFGADQLEFFEVYMRHGLARYKGGVDLAQGAGETLKADDSPRKYFVTKAGLLFGEEDWEIPYFLDDEWPCTPLVYRERPGSIWPASPLEVGLGHQRALNWLYTLYLSKARTMMRDVIAIVKQNGQGLDIETERKVLYGHAIECIKIAVSGDQGRLENFVQQFKFDLNIGDFVALNDIISREFEHATGLSEFLMTGGGNTQARSAEEIRVKDQKSRTRVEDYRAITEKHASKVARKEALAARYLCDPKDIQPIFGPEAAAAWGTLMPPLSQQEQMVLSGQMDMSAMRNDGVVLEEWVREADYSIISGSLRRKDIDQAIDAADAAMNQLVPSLIQKGAVGPSAAIIADWADKKGLDPKVSQSIQQWAGTAAQQQALTTQMEMKTLELQLLQAQIQLAMAQQPQQPAQAGAPAQGQPMMGDPNAGL
jgi:hypothetical protein